MKTVSIQQEVLLLTGTGFSSRQCQENEPAKQHQSERDQLEEACWNGQLEEMLPEVSHHTGYQKRMYLWQIKEGLSFIKLELGETPTEYIEEQLSIDPYSFLSTQLYS